VTPQETLHQQIEDAGYRIDGWHAEVSDRDSGPVTVIATHTVNGQEHHVTVQTRGKKGELEALQEIAHSIGL